MIQCILSFIIGGTVGMSLMCLLQVNRMSSRKEEDNEREQ